MENVTEGPRALEFVLSEAEHGRSRDTITIADGEGVLEAGHVLGVITASGEYASAANAEVTGSEGAEVAAAVLAYRVDATDSAVPGVAITRAAQVKAPELAYDSSVDNDTKRGTKATQLAAAGIIVR